MHAERSLKQIQKEWHGSLSAYVKGFIASLVLTVTSFSLVIARPLVGASLVYAVVGLGLVQAIVQLLFFLHLGQEPKPRWESLVFAFMMLVLFIVAGGSLWIMHDLNDRVMTDMRQVMTHD